MLGEGVGPVGGEGCDMLVRRGCDMLVEFQPHAPLFFVLVRVCFSASSLSEIKRLWVVGGGGILAIRSPFLLKGQ